MKPGAIFLLMLTGLTALILAGGLETSFEPLAFTLIGGTMAAGSANILNNYIDRSMDANMSRTRDRAIPVGMIEPRAALMLGGSLGVGSIAFFLYLVNILTAFLALGGIVFYVVVYSLWLKPVTKHNVVIGGIAGAFPPLVGWSAVEGTLSMTAITLGLLVLLWSPVHFWSLALVCKDEYKEAGIPMLPVVEGSAETRNQILIYSVALVMVSLAMVSFGGMGKVYLGSAMVLGAPMFLLSFRLWKKDTDARAMRVFHFSIFYLTVLFIAMMADSFMHIGIGL